MGEEFEWTLHYAKFLFQVPIVWHWVVVFLLYAIYRIIEHKFPNVAIYFMMVIPAGFYIFIVLFGKSTDEVRASNWLFEKVPSADFYDMWTIFNFRLVDWQAVMSQLPTMIALAVLTILMVPIRIPTLSFTTGEAAGKTKDSISFHYLIFIKYIRE